MSKDLRQTIEAVRAFQRQFQSVIELADAFDGIADIQRLASEAESRLHLAKDAETRMAEAMSLHQGKVEAAKASVASSEAAAKATLSEARDASDGIIASARAEAAKIVEVARAGAAEEIARRRAEVDKASQDMLDIARKRQALDEDLANRQREYDAVMKKMQSLRASLGVA